MCTFEFNKIRYEKYLFILISFIGSACTEKNTNTSTCSKNPDCSTIDFVDIKNLNSKVGNSSVELNACFEICIDTLENMGMILSTNHIPETDVLVNMNINFPYSSFYISLEDLSNKVVNSGEYSMSFSSLSNSTTFYYKAFTKFKESTPNSISNYKISEEQEFITN